MIINENSKHISFVPRKVSLDEINNMHIPNSLEGILNNIIEYNGEYYYTKRSDKYSMMNELIGSYLSRKINLDSVDYQIGIFDDKLYSLSKLFYDSEHTYTNCFEHYKITSDETLSESQSLFNRIYLNKDILLNSIENSALLESILKLTALDIKMGQLDRHNGNLMLQISKKDKTTTLAPIYDFECSYESDPPYPEFYFYDNPFLVLRKNGLSLNVFCKKFQGIVPNIDILRNIDIEDVLEEICEDKKILLTTDDIEYYKSKDKEYNKVLKKIF